MEGWKAALLGGTALVGTGLLGVGVADAQTAALPGGVVAVQQSGARADASSFVQGMASGSASCSVSNVTTGGATVTILPPGGNYVYLERFDVQVVPVNSTGANSAQSWTATNLTGANTGGWLTGEEAGGAAGQNGAAYGLALVWPTGLKSNSAGSTVVFAPNATVASAAECVQASGWYSPL